MNTFNVLRSEIEFMRAVVVILTLVTAFAIALVAALLVAMHKSGLARFLAHPLAAVRQSTVDDQPLLPRVLAWCAARSDWLRAGAWCVLFGALAGIALAMIRGQ